MGKCPWVCSCCRQANPICFRLLLHCNLLAASRADCTAGSNNEIKMPMIVMTTKSSTSVKPRKHWELVDLELWVWFLRLMIAPTFLGVNAQQWDYTNFVMPGMGIGYLPLASGFVGGSASNASVLGTTVYSDFIACSHVIVWPE